MSDFSSLLMTMVITGILVFLLTTMYRNSQIKKIRKQSIRQSRSVILGEVSEKLTPLFQNFPYHSKDLIFLGKGVDYVVFDGLAEGNLREIIFLEVKSGKSQLNKNEQMIRNYLARSPVRYELLQVKY